MRSIAGAAAFVTGGASGIGLGIARALAERGAHVTIADLRADHLDEAGDIAAREGWANRLLALPLDVTDRAGFSEALARSERTIGPLRILVNNAGVGIAGPVAEATHVDWDWGLSVNLGGVVNGLVAGLPLLRAHALDGHIVNTASLGALMPARPTRGVYATAKAGLIALSEHLRLDLEGSGVGVSVLLPGPTLSNIHESEQIRPAHLREGSRFRADGDGSAPRPTAIPWRDPLIVGRMTVDAILADRFYIVSHPEYLGAVKARHAAIEAAIEESRIPNG
jgi:NAD(P)-dependent dehydrogenase (short-subunit alcohol dehydrogenase family)